MIDPTTPERLLAELRLPHGFFLYDPRDPPDFGSEIVPVEIVDAAGNVRAWQWSDCSIPWHEAAGWRVRPHGASGPCQVCGRQTRKGYRQPDPARVNQGRGTAHESDEPDEFSFMCDGCDAGGDHEPW